MAAVKELLGSKEVNVLINEVADHILNDIEDIERFAIVGIQGGGIELAERIRLIIEQKTGKNLNHGTIDITFYRDDLATRGILPVIKETKIDFNITKKTILRVDDVIFTGRSVKAALETLMSFGRPSKISLFCLIDRGHRELPIQPDYCGMKISEGSIEDNVKVYLYPEDMSKDAVLIERN